MSGDRTLVDLTALPDLFAHRVARAADLVALGIFGGTVHRKCLPGGPWQRLLPGVLVLDSSPPTRSQLIQAALRYAEPGPIVAGGYALLLHGMRTAPRPGPVHVLIPNGRRVRGTRLVMVEHASLMPKPVLRQGFLVTPLERALLDGVRRLHHGEQVRAMFSEAIWDKGLSPVLLEAALAAESQQGRTLPRRVLADVVDRARTAAEGLSRQLIHAAGLPRPRWHVLLEDGEACLGAVSCWWDDDDAVAMDIDMEADNPVAGTHAKALDRHAMLTSTGVIVVHTSPRRLRHRQAEVISELRRAHGRARTRQHPRVTARGQHPRSRDAR